MTCIDCGAAFVPTGKGGRCLECRRKWDRAWRERRKSQGNPVKATKMPLSYHQQYNKEYYSRPEIKAHRAAIMREYSKRPEVAPKVRARTAVKHALEAGIIHKTPCYCGEPRVQAHHADYGKPLLVVWLCAVHHRQIHAKAEGKQ